MHLLAFDLYYKYLYYQVVFAKVNTWKVLRTSLHWSSWTELACFAGFTRFCPISLCVCMFIWVYICPCVHPTKKLATWRAVVICGGEVFWNFCKHWWTCLELQEKVWSASMDAISVSSMQTKVKWEASLQMRARLGVTIPFCPGVCVPLVPENH